MRIVVEVKRNESAEVLLNHLYSQTQLQTVFGINIVALDNGQPKVFNLKQMLEAFILHRREVVTRRTVFELRKARDRAHILEGLAIALVNIDEIIEMIKASQSPSEAKKGLVARGWQLGDVAQMLQRAGDEDPSRPEWLAPEYGIRDDEYFLTEQQAQAILDLRLHKLTGLEHDKILDEYRSLLELIAELLLILGSSERLMEVIREELEVIRDEFGDERRTEITAAAHDIDIEDLIEREDVVVTLSHEGYVKYQKLSDYEAQRRGGKGKSATKMKNEDFVEKLLIANTHDHILCFSTRGRLYWLKVYQLPLASRNARGRPIVNILPLEDNERITAILPIQEFTEDKFVVMATANGTVKKTSLTLYSRPRSNGIIAVNLNEGDELIGVDITNGEDDIMLFSDQGKVVRFNEKARDSETGEVKLDTETGEEILAIRPMGRTATGVRGIRLKDGQKVVSMIVPKGQGAVLTVTENGFGKRTPLVDYPAKSRATQGVVSIKVSDRNGKVVGAVQVNESMEIMLISDQGTLVRTRVNEVSVVGRNTQGVRLIRTSDNEKVVGLESIEEIVSDENIDDSDSVDSQIETENQSISNSESSADSAQTPED
jgi:DNA gyrase subunit A